MTIPVYKFSKEEFISNFNKVNGDIGLTLALSKYKGVDYKINVTCKHGDNSILGWQLLKPRKYCCHSGYYETGAGQSRKKSMTTRKAELAEVFSNLYILDNLRKVEGKEKLILECNDHGEFEQWTSSLKKGIGCPRCSKIKMRERGKIAAQKNFLDSGAYLRGRSNISKAETKWLNELSVPIRQHLIEETGQTVDGFNKETKTVYLYHGRFWHGCPETYDPEETHPVIKVKMKDLYKQTLEYEQKIKDAGYKLVIQWGT